MYVVTCNTTEYGHIFVRTEILAEVNIMMMIIMFFGFLLPATTYKSLHFPALSVQPWRWRQYLSPKRWCYLPTSLHSAKTQKNLSPPAIFTTQLITHFILPKINVLTQNELSLGRLKSCWCNCWSCRSSDWLLESPEFPWDDSRSSSQLRR
jgi:hypothetical protein